ncbi:hypothetical protein Q4S45_19840 [Massilia sp. R2A-15]|uniref:hypothetical protein n=1 Tax=Massilia sp. R2A-15 TaxID=3064278 RepID=UPI002735C7BB|nr:hypothetical protein [Massilia sp. R2A-15]WLI88931.1 hypothetical protein Q4S45_19840 [Massilia sp. R2A-15]
MLEFISTHAVGWSPAIRATYRYRNVTTKHNFVMHAHKSLTCHTPAVPPCLRSTAARIGAQRNCLRYNDFSARTLIEEQFDAGNSNIVILELVSGNLTVWRKALKIIHL